MRLDFTPHMLTVETTRLVLRLPTEGDAPALAALHSHPLVTGRILGGVPSGDSVELAWRNIAMHLGHWQLRGYGTWVVCEKASGAVIGRIGLWHPPSWPGPELGWLIHPDRWKQGYATEGTSAALTWIWASTSLDYVISLITPDNHASIRLATKLGYLAHETRHVLDSVAVEYRLVRPGVGHPRLGN